MPWTKQDFDDLYQCKARFAPTNRDATLYYGRQYARYVSRTPYKPWLDKVKTLADNNLWRDTATVLIVGAGFGYLMAAMRFNGSPIANLWGIDNSPYIHANKAKQVVPLYPEIADKIYNVSVLDAALGTKIINTTSLSKFDLVIDDGVMISMSATERSLARTNLAPFVTRNTRIVHFVNVTPSPPDNMNPRDMPKFNQIRDKRIQPLIERGWAAKTLAEWLNENSSHYWIDNLSLRVFGGA